MFLVVMFSGDDEGQTATIPEEWLVKKVNIFIYTHIGGRNHDHDKT